MKKYTSKTLPKYGRYAKHEQRHPLLDTVLKPCLDGSSSAEQDRRVQHPGEHQQVHLPCSAR